MMVRYALTRAPKPRPPLTPEQIAEIETRAPRDEEIVYDEDCPELTDEQLRQFRRGNPRRRFYLQKFPAGGIIMKTNQSAFRRGSVRRKIC